MIVNQISHSPLDGLGRRTSSSCAHTADKTLRKVSIINNSCVYVSHRQIDTDIHPLGKTFFFLMSALGHLLWA